MGVLGAAVFGSMAGVLGVLALLSELHGMCTRQLEEVVGVHDGLTTAARAAKKRKAISARMARRMERLDIATHFARHISGARVALVAGELAAELAPRVGVVAPDPWAVGPGPWSRASAASPTPLGPTSSSSEAAVQTVPPRDRQRWG